MNRIDIRLPGTGSASVLASFYGKTSGAPSGNEASHPSGPANNKAPIAQRPLSEPTTELWLAAGTVTRSTIGRFEVSRSRDYQFLLIELPIGDQSIRKVTEQAYQELLALLVASDYPQLLRFWNYVPDINAGADDAEVYRQFCWGRAEAFHASAEPIDERALPAATAIGAQDGVLRISALTGSPRLIVRHLENPRQVSAYHYPRQYGPRSPSFARATELSVDDQALLLLSGTSSIVHHQTCHPHNLCAQTAETQRNIAELLSTATHSKRLLPRQLRCYLRAPEDLQAAQQAYDSAFSGYPEPSFVQGDICRAALLMEIDGVFSTA